METQILAGQIFFNAQIKQYAWNRDQTGGKRGGRLLLARPCINRFVVKILFQHSIQGRKKINEKK